MPEPSDSFSNALRVTIYYGTLPYIERSDLASAATTLEMEAYNNRPDVNQATATQSSSSDEESQEYESTEEETMTEEVASNHEPEKM
jgi:hypothetical protein